MKRLFILTLFAFALSVGVFAQDGTATAAAKSTAEAKPKRGPVFRPTKDQIMQVQKILIDKKLYAGTATGKYDDGTRNGIKSFQKDNGLKQTGTLNRATLEKFGIELTETQKAIPVSPNSFETATPASSTTGAAEKPKKTIFRATKDQITSAQNILKEKTFYMGTATGKLDDPTRDGLKKYQQANSLNVTGTLNQVTLEKMGIALTDAQKAAQK